MIGKRVRALRGDHYGQIGEVINLAQNVVGIKQPVYCVWFGGTDSALLFKHELEVIV